MLGKAYFYYFTEKRYPANCVKNDKHGIRSRNCAESVDLGIIRRVSAMVQDMET